VDQTAAEAAGQAAVTDSQLEQAGGTRMVSLQLGAEGGRVVSVPLEVYVARVIAGEGEPNAPAETQQALAIAIRTYATVYARRHAKEGFGLCDTTHCQVLRTSSAASRRAALATAGRVLTYNGAPAEVFYSASCGGHSERASYVWPGTDFPYLQAVEDDVHGEDEDWMLDLTLREIQRLLLTAGVAGTRLDGLEIDSRNESGRVATLRLPGLRPDVMAGAAFRMAVGPRTLRSTAFTIERRGDTIRFTGRGYGHGVGMCVIGAGRRARRGETVEDILHAYYPGLRLATLDAASSRGVRVDQ
jgi:stage II sporulation protein D